MASSQRLRPTACNGHSCCDAECERVDPRTRITRHVDKFLVRGHDAEVQQFGRGDTVALEGGDGDWPVQVSDAQSDRHHCFHGGDSVLCAPVCV